ncbi:hypothetical protein CFP65_2142 [Kitasatospora sp. MMS16-BH015]|uniref:hypothetical protein n=1 Tax=Kitasatospora sp. MMS16-BH015 TaxID=2018025 RepID=UPI000CA0CDFA|nr:hypothetical protein [Kitasatospora sp. MMS16-BH015]AUG76995.1 hypothetical protein CFP65_2142 [Kitasatospora sp. MMS16-BH015]
MNGNATNGSAMTGSALRITLRLHPTAYRREMGAELSAVFADATAGAGRWATGRELLDLAAHGLRLRLGLGSSGAPAHAAGLAAPFAAGALAAEVASLVSGWRWGWEGMDFALTHPMSSGGQEQYSGLLGLLALLAALSGRWTAARLLAPVAVLALLWNFVFNDFRDWTPHGLVFVASNYGPRLLWLLILLAAPRDLLRRSWRSALTVLAGAATGSLLFWQTSGFWPFLSLRPVLDGPAFALVLCTVELALLLAAPAALRQGRYGPAGAALAGAPVLSLVLALAANQLWKDFLPTALVLLAVVAAAVPAANRLRRAVGAGDRLPPTAG